MSESRSSLEHALEIGSRIMANVQKVIIGKEYIVKLGVAALFAKGHLLVDGVPGVGKTMFAKSLALSI